jgi:PAS domain S-box-containing protein
VMDEVLAALEKRTNEYAMTLSDVTESDASEVFFETDETKWQALSDLVKRVPIKLYGREWLVEIRAKPLFVKRLNLTDPKLSGGIIVALFALLAGLLHLLLQRSQHRAMEGLTSQIVEANRFSQAVIDGAAHLIIATDTDGLIRTFNRAAQRSLGYNEDEVVGKVTPAQFHYFDEVLLRAQELTNSGMPVEPGFEVFVASARDAKEGDTHEWTYVRKDGSRFPVSLTVTALRDEQANITGFLGIATDISEEKRAIQVKLQDDRRLHEAQHIAKLGSWDLDLASGKLIWSDEIFNLFEINKSDFGASYEAFLNAVHPNDRDAVNLAHTRSLESHLPYEITLRLLMSDGRIKWVHEHCTSDFDEDGTHLRSRGTVQDITELRQAEDAVQESFLRTQTILDNVMDGIITINERGDVESFNQSAEKIFGYQADEVIGRNVKMLMQEQYHGEHDGYLHNYVNTGKKKIIGIGRQVVGRRKDGTTFPMDLAISEMTMGERRMFTGIVRDITERVKMERMKSEFISTVSHELRTPLTSIRGSLALIVGGVVGELPAAAKPLVDIAHKNSERLILLVNDILDMEKIEAGKMEFDMKPIQLIPLLEHALTSNRAYGEQHKVGYVLENELPGVMVKADENRLMQVLANLLSNAAKFSLPGGLVRVGIDQIGQRIRISIKDNGLGIPSEFQSRIFQKFAQADASDTKKKGGTGLGLSITKAIVEQMGGHIGFTSKPNVLTIFFIEFPVFKEAEVAEPKSAERAVKNCVLVCEDDQDVSALLRILLEQAGMEVDIARDALEAKQKLVQKKYAAMTIDLSMPDQDGISLIRELRSSEATAGLPIVVVSAYVKDGKKELDAEALSMVDWISKPIDENELLNALNFAIRKSPNIQPKVIHVEDDPDICRLVKAVVGESAEVVSATNLSEARDLLRDNHFDLAILDVTLPDGSGMELMSELNSSLPPTPVMVFSASELSREDKSTIQAALLKSRTENEQLLATILRLIGDKST